MPLSLFAWNSRNFADAEECVAGILRPLVHRRVRGAWLMLLENKNAEIYERRLRT